MALNSITYADKSDINNNTSVPDTNKVKATDMNEIKTVVNAGINQINGLTGTVLWTNASPQAETTMTINLSSSDYDIILIIIAHSYDSNLTYSSIAPKGNDFRIVGASNTGTLIRSMTYVSGTQYTLGSIEGSSTGKSDSLLIPLYVIGYKTGLF